MAATQAFREMYCWRFRSMEIRVKRAAAIATVLFCALPAPAALRHRAARNSGGNAKISLRKRLHVNTLITEPGTAEIDWSSLYSATTGSFAIPSAIKYTPEGTNIFWGRTEYSVAFDSLTSTEAGGARQTQFSQAVTVTGTSVLHDGAKLDVAFAPQASFFLRDEEGSRVGGVVITRYDSGRNSSGITVGWSGANRSSATNPAGTLDAGFGYGRQLSGSRFLERFTTHINGEWERSTGSAPAVLAFEGLEYQVNGRWAVDLSAQHFATSGSAPDHQLALGLTLNLGTAH